MHKDRPNASYTVWNLQKWAIVKHAAASWLLYNQTCIYMQIIRDETRKRIAHLVSLKLHN